MNWARHCGTCVHCGMPAGCDLPRDREPMIYTDDCGHCDGCEMHETRTDGGPVAQVAQEVAQ